MEGVSSHILNSLEARSGRSSGWFAEKLIPTKVLGDTCVWSAIRTAGDIDSNLHGLIGGPRLYEADVSLARIGEHQVTAEVSCGLYDLDMSGTEKHD